MTNQEFDRFMDSLGAYYGHKAFSPAVKSTIWRFISPLTATQAEQVIVAITEQVARTPTPAQIKQAALPQIHRAQDRIRQAELAKTGASSCQHCAGSGILIALLKENPIYEFSFGCLSCDSYNVRKLKHPPIWDADKHDAKYQIVPLKADGYELASSVRFDAYAKLAEREEAKRSNRHKIFESVKPEIKPEQPTSQDYAF